MDNNRDYFHAIYGKNTFLKVLFGGPDGIRNRSLSLRRRLRYPVTLQDQSTKWFYRKKHFLSIKKPQVSWSEPQIVHKK